ncbi:MAG: M81 family metallopeptidase [Paracoccaceae bacterium]
MSQPRIAIAGFQHETNTFAPGLTVYRDFEIADSWPRMLHGADVISETQGLNLPIAGFAEAARNSELLPILWCAAEPGGYATDDAFDRIATRILDGLAAAGALNGIYLDLHGAMVTESHEDGEGALLERIRAATGPDIPIAVSLDLHANVTARMVSLADVITIYRTYPHLDMAETGARAWPLLRDRIEGRSAASAFRQVPFLVPLHAQHTGAEPCRGLYAALNNLPDDTHAEIALGFTAADIADVGPSVVAYAPDETRAKALADDLYARIETAAPRFDCNLLSPEEAVVQAMIHPGNVIIADVQDNPGAGASSDTTGMLAALIKAGAPNALVGLLCDPDVAAMAHKNGLGAMFNAALGGHSGAVGDLPLKARFKVVALSDGRANFTGEMYGGGIAELGPSAVLQIEGFGIEVVVTSQRSQCLDLGLFRHFGLEPRTFKIVVVKSTAHFRADFEPIASRIVNAAAPGLFPCRTSEIRYTKARPGLRHMP